MGVEGILQTYHKVGWRCLVSLCSQFQHWNSVCKKTETMVCAALSNTAFSLDNSTVQEPKVVEAQHGVIKSEVTEQHTTPTNIANTGI